MSMLALLLIVAQAPAPDCRHDRATMLALPLDRFDQDMAGGWRALSARGCDAQAADLIRDWRAANPVDPQRAGMLAWHEGQLRANAGQTAEAIALFERARKTPQEDAGFGWNLYVDGSVAFLRRDRAALDAARAKLAVLPRPAGYAPRRADGTPATVRWPMNLGVLDGFRRCWDRPYKVAYACPAAL